jgi:hypothetical protein
MPKGPQVSHYMVDYELADGAKHSFHIKAGSEAEAIREAQRFAPLKNPVRYAVRAVARSGDAIIYRSDDAKGS